MIIDKYKYVKFTLGTFIYSLKRWEVQFQTGKFRIKPWFNYDSNTDANSGTEYTNLFSGWLCFQCRWTYV